MATYISEARRHAISDSRKDTREGVIYRVLTTPDGKAYADQHFIGNTAPDILQERLGATVVETYRRGRRIDA